MTNDRTNANSAASNATVAVLYKQYMENRRPPEGAPHDLCRVYRSRFNAAFDAARTLKPTSMEDLAMLLVIRTERNMMGIDDELFGVIKAIADEAVSTNAAGAPTIAGLFDEWSVLNRRAVDDTLPESDMDEASAAAFAVDAQMQGIPAVTAADLAKKFVANTLTNDVAPSPELVE